MATKTFFPQTLGEEDPMAPPGWVNPYDAAIRQQQARMAKPQAPMYSPEEVQQRRADNERQFQLGLLGQLSGDENLGAVGGQVLRQAMAARAPKGSEKGSFDPITGQFTYSPDYLREKDEAALAGLEQKRAGAEANRASQLQAEQARRELMMERAQSQRELRAMMGANRDAAQQGTNAKRNADLEDRMADDFNRDTKTQTIVSNAYKNLQAISQRADAASDIAFIYSYMKMLDPGSVVREGEFATAQNAAGIPDRIRNAYNSALEGTRLNPTQRRAMLGTAANLAAQADASIREVAGQYGEKGKRRGLNVDNIIGVIPTPAGQRPAQEIDVGAALNQPGKPSKLPKSNPPRVVETDW